MRYTFLSLLLLAFASLSHAQITEISITNADFESNTIADGNHTTPTGWTTSHVDGAGATNLTSTQMPGEAGSGVQGNTGFANDNHWLYQQLGVTLKANHTYDLSFIVGMRSDTVSGTNYTVEFMYDVDGSGNGTVLATVDSDPLPADGEWGVGSLSYTVPTGHASIGEYLVIKFTSDTGQTNWDDLVLTESLPDWVREDDNIHFLGERVGIGTNAPRVKLDVRGALQLGDVQTGDTVVPGTVIYNDTTDCLEFWNGREWRNLCGESQFDQDLILQYTFDDSSNLDYDTASPYYDAALTNVTFTSSAAVDAGAGVFGTGLSRAEFTSHLGDMNLGLTGTVTGWIKSTDISGTVFDISRNINGSTDESLQLLVGNITGSFSDECLSVGFKNSSGFVFAGYVTGCDTTFLDGNWHHFAFVMDTTSHKLYIDGVQQTPSYVHGSANVGNKFMGAVSSPEYAGFGARRNLGSIDLSLEGDMDELAIWDRVLTTSEIEALYDAGP